MEIVLLVVSRLLAPFLFYCSLRKSNTMPTNALDSDAVVVALGWGQVNDGWFKIIKTHLGRFTAPLLKLPITKIVINLNIKRYRFMQL
jgi:hypothetical protein